jgi:putative cell wall-binding protein
MAILVVLIGMVASP